MPEMSLLTGNVYPLALANAERELGPAFCDRCAARGVDWLGVYWLCANCRKAALSNLLQELHPYGD
jgi:hypothetical protein